MYRELQHAHRDIDRLQEYLRAAMLADDVSEIGAHMGVAQALALQIDHHLEALVTGTSAAGEEHSTRERLAHEVAHTTRQLMDEIRDPGAGAERRRIEVARQAIANVITGVQRVQLRTTASQMLLALIDCKTNADYADAYVREALGMEVS